jgi:protein-tyrosine phosphatase
MDLVTRITPRFRPFLMHPALSSTGAIHPHAFAMEGIAIGGRTKRTMAMQISVAQKTQITGKMVLKAMRNLLVGLLVFLILGNTAIFFAFKVFSGTDAARPLPAIPSIENLHSVDAKVWRGSAPEREGYAELASRGVTTIVDLRAEDLKVDKAYIESLGMELVRIPMRDGQAPSDDQVKAFLATVDSAEGTVYLHCGAGVGRTGTMAAAYLVNSGQASAFEAVQRNLAVGPPSLEQIAFAAGLSKGEEAGSESLITAMSRVLDAPRRILVRLRNSYGH